MSENTSGRVEIPDFTSIIDSEQSITREIDFGVADGDTRFDFEASYRGGTFRPYRIKLYYRVNRGSSEPYWYLFRMKISAARVLKGGGVSKSYNNMIADDFYPERAPEWAREIGSMLLPSVEVERTLSGV